MKAPEPNFTSMARPCEAGGELLRQDRGGEEVERLDRAGDVADGVEAPVGRRELGGLADDGAAGLAHDAAKRLEVRLRDVARDRVHLVEGAAGVAEAASGDHRHEAAAGRDRGREHEADGVADAAGRVLVEDGAGQVPGEHRAGGGHGARQRDALRRRHAAEEHRHGEGRGLALGHRAGGEPVDEVGDLLFGERPPVALGADDLLGEVLPRSAHSRPSIAATSVS